MLALLASAPRQSFKIKDLARALGVRGSAYKDLRQCVLDLGRAGRIAVLPRRHFQHIGAARMQSGEVLGAAGRASHVGDGEGRRWPLSLASLEEVAPGDRVQFRRAREESGTVALVQRVEWAAPRRVFGHVECHGGHCYLIPDRAVPGLRGGIAIPSGLLEAEPPQDEEWLASARIAGFEPNRERPQVESLELHGSADHPRAAMARRIAEAAWPLQFGAEAQALAETTAQAGEDRERRDLRDQLVFTIDPAQAKDHDDAIAIESLPDGGARLYVHIADVASFVESGNALDAEARARATSVYPPGEVLPMLPEVLSAGSCSLHHGVQRRVLTAAMEYDSDGVRRTISVGRSFIRSRASLSYEQAEALLEDLSHGVPSEQLDEGVELRELRDSLTAMHELASALRRRRRAAGSIFLERPEREFEFDEAGHVCDQHLRVALESHWIIEEFMLEANRAVAESLHAVGMPLLWRAHDDPDLTKVEELCKLLEKLGVRWKPKSPPDGHDYMDLLRMVHEREDRQLLHLLALRSLMKAEYRAEWSRHFGLAFSEYTHFTSPIRRYPDLHNQRWLHRLIDAAGDGGWIETGGRGLGRRRGLVQAADRQQAQELGSHCSQREREASLIERDCGDICSADLLKPREGEEFEGRIVSLVNSGFFVELEGQGVDGFVGLDQLPNDWYSLDPSRHAFVGERSGQRLTLGQRVRVMLEFADVRNGRLWLGFVRAERKGPRRPQSKKER